MFRSEDNVRKTDFIRFNLRDPPDGNVANNELQRKIDFTFDIKDRSTWFDWYNGYFLIKYPVERQGNGGDLPANAAVTVDGTPAYNGGSYYSTINDSSSIIEKMMITSSGRKLYDSDNLHKINFVKSLLEYSQDYAKTVATQSGWYLDEDLIPTLPQPPVAIPIERFNQIKGGVAARNKKIQRRNIIDAIIPLHKFSFFQKLFDKMLPPMQIEIKMKLLDDNEFIYRLNFGPAARYIVTDMQLWLPRLNFTASGPNLVNSTFLRPIKWKYLREYFQFSTPRRDLSGMYQISTAVKDAKHVFVYLQRNKTNQQNENPFIFDNLKLNIANNNCSLSTCRLQ